MSREAATPVDRALTAARRLSRASGSQDATIGLAGHLMVLAAEVATLRAVKAIDDTPVPQILREARRNRSELLRFREALPGLIGCNMGDFGGCHRSDLRCCDRRRHAAYMRLVFPIAEAAE